MSEPSTLLAQVTEIVHKAATEPYKNDGEPVYYVTSGVIDTLQKIGNLAASRNQFNSREEHEKGFRAITDKIRSLGDLPVQHLSRLVALDTIAANVVNSAERAATLHAPKDEIRAFLLKYLNEAGDRNMAINTLGEKLNTLIISLTHTMHPTIYHTPEARKFEAELTELLEDPKNLLPNVQPPRLSSDGKKKVEEKFREFVEKLAHGTANISPKRPMTVSVETQAEKENLDIIREELKKVIEAWNAAVRELKLPNSLTITPERKHEMLEFRTWGQSADADGREKSTSQFLYECIQDNLKNYDEVVSDKGKQDILECIKKQQGSDKAKVYDGFTMDVRQNAKEAHLPFMDALIQVTYRNSKNGRYGEKPEFAAFCEEFLKSHLDYDIKNPADFRFSMMKGFDKDSSLSLEDDRTQFVSDIVRNGYRLIPKQIGIDTIAFNTGKDNNVRPTEAPIAVGSGEQIGIPEIKKAFLKRYKNEIKEAGYDPDTIQYAEMGNVTIPHDVKKPNDVKVSLRGAWDAVVKLNGWEILHGGLQYSRLPNGAPHEPILDFWHYVNPNQIRVQNFLQGADKLNNSGEEIYKNGQKFDVEAHYEPISLENRATFTDVAKRLFVINHAIEKYGPKVATRYQIANFSEPSDFMILLKLFQDTGIAEIENGVVKSSKLAIQPLLETGEDLRNAPKIFEKLLKNPIARSFWEARGNEAEFMIGHSDGAASVGNFASEWAIYKATRELTVLFEKEGIKARFFHGRGRGVNRGGTIDPALHAELLSPEETKRGIYDVTIQSDLPMDLAASQAYGKDYFTKILLSTLNASLTAPQRMSKTEKARLMPLEKTIDDIAGHCGQYYEEFVRKNPEVLKLFNNVSDNPYKTSRNVSRDSGAKVHKDFDKIRAIPKEYLSNSIDLPVHNVGLRQAMDDYGTAQQGVPALAELNQHSFFKSIMQTIGAGMAHYDPTIALAHGNITESKKFVEQVIPQLDGLSERVAELTFSQAWKSGAVGQAVEKKRKLSFNPSSQSSFLDQIAHGIIVASIEKGKPAKPNPNRLGQRDWVDTLYNALFVTAQEIRNVQLPWQLREPQTSLAL